MKLKLPGRESKIGRLSDVLYIPSLAYYLLSVAKATEAGKTVKFTETCGDFFNDQGEVVAAASKPGSLYYLNCEPLIHEINSTCHQVKENTWHCRFGQSCMSGKIHQVSS